MIQREHVVINRQCDLPDKKNVSSCCAQSLLISIYVEVSLSPFMVLFPSPLQTTKKTHVAAARNKIHDTPDGPKRTFKKASPDRRSKLQKLLRVILCVFCAQRLVQKKTKGEKQQTWGSGCKNNQNEVSNLNRYGGREARHIRLSPGLGIREHPRG